MSDGSSNEIGFRGPHTSKMLCNDDDLAYIENRMSRYTSIYMSAAAQKISGGYLLNSGLSTTYGRPNTNTHFSTVLLYYYIGS